MIEFDELNDTITYLAFEMARSNALDFDLQTELLPILKGRIPDEPYAKSILPATIAQLNKWQQDMAG
ncbi:hypothetical protein [Fibrella arboris]|uniref:hypothetical protein n=1 Tax=Fibrella arboris TaxID=3242486 RepID=UPI00352004D8